MFLTPKTGRSSNRSKNRTIEEVERQLANQRSSTQLKESRTARRNVRLEENDAYEQAERIMYGPGIAD